MAVYPFSPGNTSDPTLDAIAVELEAMQVIARALAGVRDPRIRQRAVQGATDRFGAGPAPQPPAARRETTKTASERGRAVELPPAPATAVAPVRDLRSVREPREPRE